MKTSYRSFVSFENKLALRSALHALLPSKPRTLESSFLQIFAGLESLVLDFKRRKELEFILPESSWHLFKKYLMRCIKNSVDPKIEKNQRGLIYAKLNELNRVSLKEAFETFCKHYSVAVTDLWPVFAENRDSLGLSDIRNRIIHGEAFPSFLIGPLSIACEHMEYVLQRVITRVLGWNIYKTSLDPFVIEESLWSIKELPQAMKELSMFINNEESF